MLSVASQRLVLQVSSASAFVGSLVVTTFFVAALHLWKLLGYRDPHRDEPGTIQRRAVSSILSCLFSGALILSRTEPDSDGSTIIVLLGLQTEDLISSTFYCVSLTALLFFGPLVQHILEVSHGCASIVQIRMTWISLRNILLAPAAEEFVFRACLVRLWCSAPVSLWVIVSCSPLCFALAHTHHFVEQLRNSGDKVVALKVIGFQVFYTSLFGTFSTFLLLRTGSTLAVIATHSFCNHMGFPDLSFLVSKRSLLFPYRKWIGGCYLVGIMTFSFLIVPMTSGFKFGFIR